jgi:PAS domain S-box-containing protein
MPITNTTSAPSRTVHKVSRLWRRPLEAVDPDLSSERTRVKNVRLPTSVAYRWPTFAAAVLLLALTISWAGPHLVFGDHDAPLETVAAWVIVAAGIAVPPCMLRRQRTLRCAQAALDKAARRFTAVTEATDELVGEVGADGTINYLSSTVQGYLGYEPEELIGRSIMRVLHPREHGRSRSLLESSVAKRQGWSGERYVFLTKTGDERLLVGSGALHVGPDNAILGFTGTLRRPEAVDVQGVQVEALRHRIRRVMSAKTFHTLYQPIIDIQTGETVGAEALTRFTAEPQQAPDRWFTDAGNVGLGPRLELAALALALHGANELPGGLYLSVNLSPAAMASSELLTVLTHSHLPLQRVVIEITEHVSVQDYSTLRANIEGLRERGARLAVDDAGAGYASFRHILRLAPDYIKLDRTLIDGLESDPAQRALVNAVGTFANEIGATVIAEGIETAAELNLCRQMGLGAAQGYYIARPARLGPSWGPTSDMRTAKKSVNSTQ